MRARKRRISAEPNVSTSLSSASSPWDKLTVVELKAHLRDHNLAVSGLKEDLIQRLKNHEVVVDERLLQSVKKNKKSAPKKTSVPKKKKSVPKKKPAPKKKSESAPKFSIIRFTVTKPENGTLGLRFDNEKLLDNEKVPDECIDEQLKGLPQYRSRVTGFVPGSVFIMTPLTTGMILESVNGVKCNGYNTCDLFTNATGEIKIIAKRFNNIV